MKRVIFAPDIDEIIPDGAVYYELPIAGPVFDALVEDDWDTFGTIHYDSSAVVMEDVDGQLVPKAVPMAEPHVHHFAGWEV